MNLQMKSKYLMQSTCLKWSPKGSLKIGCLRQVTPQCRFIFTEFWFKGPKKRWLLKAGDPLIEVTTAGLTVCVCFQGNATLPNFIFASLLNSDQSTFKGNNLLSKQIISFNPFYTGGLFHCFVEQVCLSF